MPPDDATRTLVVDALDDLGERERIDDAWRADSDERPYPPKAVRQRSRRLRWRVRGRRIGLLALSLLMAGTGGLGMAGVSLPGVLFGLLLGVGVGVLGASLFAAPRAEAQVRALPLYDLLKQIDGVSDPVE